MARSFLTLVLFEGLGIKSDSNVLFSLFNATAWFLVGLLVPTPGSAKSTPRSEPVGHVAPDDGHCLTPPLVLAHPDEEGRPLARFHSRK
jgi:hypothetical protein